MRRKCWVGLIKENSVVTEPYLRAIGDSYASLGFDVKYVYDVLSGGDLRQDVYVVAVAPSAARLAKKGAKHIVFWAQGIWPEESYMRNGSRMRFAYCGLIEKTALRKAERLFLVSNAQLEHYEKKYRLALRGKAYVMPCSNAVFHDQSFELEGKYSHPVFVYAGSLAKYQCIDRMLDAFAAAQAVKPSAELLFYTGQQEEAKTLVEARGLKNVTVGYAKPSEMDGILARAKYGFVIRDDSAVNRVATPTKISSYISNGVIPVYTASLRAFEETSNGVTKLLYDENTFMSLFSDFEEFSIDSCKLREEYRRYFDSQFNLVLREDEIADFLKGSDLG